MWLRNDIRTGPFTRDVSIRPAGAQVVGMISHLSSGYMTPINYKAFNGAIVDPCCLHRKSALVSLSRILKTLIYCKEILSRLSTTGLNSYTTQQMDIPPLSGNF